MGLRVALARKVSAEKNIANVSMLEFLVGMNASAKIVWMGSAISTKNRKGNKTTKNLCFQLSLCPPSLVFDLFYFIFSSNLLRWEGPIEFGVFNKNLRLLVNKDFTASNWGRYRLTALEGDLYVFMS